MMEDQNIPVKKEKSDVAVSGSDDISALKRRLDAQQKKIDSIWQLMGDKKKIEQIVEDNDSLKKQVAEKDGLLKVLKDKLTDKASRLKELEQKNSEMEKDVESYKKKLFEFSNKIGAIENRVHSTDEQNQKILYELMKAKERLKEAEQEIAEKDALIKAKEDEFSDKMAAAEKHFNENKRLIMEKHSKKAAVLHATIDSLKTKLAQQNHMLGVDLAKESAVLKEMVSKIGSLLSERDSLSGKFKEIYATAEGLGKEQKEGADIDEIKVPEFSPGPDTATAAMEVDADAVVSRVDEIIPMVDLAIDHGDDEDSIRASLKGSGYSDKDIDAAFSALNIVKNQ
jgi:chromosome segregation ATPase